MFALQRGEDSWHDSVRLCDDHVNTNSAVGGVKPKMKRLQEHSKEQTRLATTVTDEHSN